jgi:peptidoglycan/LPS O-acetylase OafA/YrhL
MQGWGILHSNADRRCLIAAEQPKAGTGTRGFRADIQGLRAIAVALVVVYHLWPERLTGGYVGVDVFFVISGFLITSHLIKKPPRTAKDLAQFYGRRIRRLLPAAFVVLGATAAATRLIAPPTLWEGIAKEVIASALYVQNWVLAGSSVDYLAAENNPTPTQHFWSLSVEEQFYLLWPVIILAAFWAAGKARLKPLALVRPAIGLVFAASLAFSVYATAAEPGSAYFITPTRMWELAAGGLVATLAPLAATRLSQAAIAVLAWIGAAAIAISGVTFTEATPFPGYTAALPVFGTALVILAASGHRLSPTAVFAARPVQWLGDISYSVYLWHWPLIVLLPFATGGDLGWLDKLVILAAALVLATLSKTFVEDRFRFTRAVQGLVPTYRFAAAGMAVLVAAGGLQLAEVGFRTQQAQQHLASVETGNDPCLGAAAAAKGAARCPPHPDEALVPDPALAKKDRSDAYKDQCWSNSPFTDRPVCKYGHGETKVALVGNSHAGQWLPALQVLADRNDWTISTYLVSRCNPTEVPLKFDTQEKSDNCRAYGDWVLDQTTGGQYDLVITSERQSVPVQGASWKTTEDAAVHGYRSYLAEWEKAGTNVLVIKDPPYPGNKISSIPDCLAEHDGDAAACSGTPKQWHWMDPLFTAALDLHSPHIETVDLDRYFCPGGTCEGAIGSVVTYSDGSHITATYAKTLAPYLERPIRDALKG